MRRVNSIRLRQYTSIYTDLTILYGDRVAGQADNALHKRLAWVMRVRKDNDVSSMRPMHCVGQFIDQDALPCA
jgi:hypothetical protein